MGGKWQLYLDCTCRKCTVSDTYIDVLTHQNTKACKPNLVYNLFEQNTADAILNTSLFPQVTAYTLVWKGEKSGCYFEVLLS